MIFYIAYFPGICYFATPCIKKPNLGRSIEEKGPAYQQAKITPGAIRSIRSLRS